jgi:hypothetical protein
MLRVAGGLFSEKQLRSGRKHGEIAGNLSFYCPSILGSMPRMDDQYMGVGTGMSNFKQVECEAPRIDQPDLAPAKRIP